MPMLFEELFLLSIHEENGRPVAAARRRLPYVVSGALLEELALLTKVRVEENHRLSLVDPAPTGDKFLDEALKKIQAARKPHRLTYWVEALTGKPKKTRRALAQRLMEQGFVNDEDGRLSLVALAAGNTSQTASAKYWLKSRLREQVLASDTTELHDQALLGLLRAGNLLFLVFTNDELKTARRRIYESRVGKALQEPRAQALEEIEDAVEALNADD